MLKEIFGAIFGSQNERDIKKIKPVVDKINSLEPEIQKISNEQLLEIDYVLFVFFYIIGLFYDLH